MKTILFIIILLACMSTNTYSQGKYKSLKKCGKDTLTYIKYNFHDNKQRYIGKKMQFLMDEWESFITYSYMARDTGPWAPEEMRSKVNGLELDYLFPHEQEYYKSIDKEYYSISIIFNVPPYIYDYFDYERISKNENGIILLWSKKQYYFFKDYTIKDIMISNAKGYISSKCK